MNDPPIRGSAEQSYQPPAAYLRCERLVLLRPVIEEVAGEPITPAIVTRLRRRYGDDAQTITRIAALQSKAREKFGPGTWMVTERSLAQASDRDVAAYKAKWFGSAAVLDLCGGAGGDAIHLARRGPVLTLDSDPLLTAMAAANLRSAAAVHRCDAGAGFAASAVCADATRYRTGRAAVHIDPDRRSGDKRRVRPEDYSPPLEFLVELARRDCATVIKLAPAAALESSPLARIGHRLWISLDRSVREQSLLCGDALAAAGVSPAGRSAVRLLRNGTAERFTVEAETAARLEQLDRSLKESERAMRLLIDLDPAVRAAGLTAAFAERHDLSVLGRPSGFLTADVAPPQSSLVQRFETLWFGSADIKRLKRQLRNSGYRLQSIKVRGTDHDPARLQRQLAGNRSGEATQPVTLFIGRTRNGAYAALARELRDF